VSTLAGGLRWTLLGFAGNRVITFASTVVLARLLVPADFGLVTLAILVIGVIGVFGDLGFGAAQIVRQDLGPEQQRTILTVSLLVALVVTVLSAASSPLAAIVFDEPRLRSILPVLALNAVASGAGWFYETLLQRELKFRARFAARMAQAVTYATLALVLAASGAGVWSIVVGTLAGTAVYSLTLIALAPYRVRPGFDRAVAADVYRSGRGFIVQGGTAFLRQNVDYVALGQARGATDLGVYSLAYRVAELPKVALADPLANVTFPTFARMRASGEDTTERFLRVLGTLALATGLIGALLSGAADPFVRLVYGDKWLAMIGPLAILGLWAALRPVEVTMSWLLNALGEVDALARIGAITLALLVPTVVAAAHLGGITAVAWVLLGEMVVTTLWVVVLLRRRAGIAFGQVWAALRPALLAFGPAWAAARLVSEGFDAAPVAISLGLAAGAGTLAYLAVVAVTDRAALRRAWTQARGLAGRATA
jgi:PST family polysaccharide transporter